MVAKPKPKTVNAPKFIGHELLASVVGVSVKDGSNGRLISTQLEIVLRGQAMKAMPAFVVNAMKPGNDVRQIALQTDMVSVGAKMRRASDGEGKTKIEEGTLKAGLRLRYGGNAGVEPCAFVTYVTPYKADRLRWFGDHLEQFVKLTFFNLQTEQKEMPGLTPPKMPTKKRGATKRTTTKKRATTKKETP